MAPSAGNGQPVEIIIVKNQTNKEKLSYAAYSQRQITQASVVLVICADLQRAAERYGERGRTLYCLQDTAAAIMNIMLTAVSLDLGTCWIGAFSEEDVRNAINASKDIRPVALIPVGYPNESPPARSRRSTSEIVHEESF